MQPVETGNDMASRRCVLIALALLILAGCSQSQRVRWQKQQIEETKQRGNQIVQAIEAFRTDHGAYPKSLAEVSPKYLPEVPQPTWGLKSWKYEITVDGFDLRVDESSQTGNGDALWLRYLGKRHGWGMGD
jgi:type II secretory pathway pseudopilin PulG